MAYDTIDVDPLKPRIGAIVSGINLAVWDYFPHVRSGFRVQVEDAQRQ